MKYKNGSGNSSNWFNLFCLIVGVLPSIVALSLPEGTNSGGGGAFIKTAFRMRSYEVLNMVRNNDEASKACDPKILADTIGSMNISIVPELINKGLNKPVKDDKLDAWSMKNDVQLLEGKWDHLLDPDRRDEATDITILHEIYRATGVCDDEDEKISVSAIRRSDEKFVESFEMVFPANFDTSPINVSGDRDLKNLLCEKNPTKGSICLVSYNQLTSRSATHALVKVVSDKPSESYSKDIDGDGVFEPTYYQNSKAFKVVFANPQTRQRLADQIQARKPGESFIVVYDRQFAQVFVGYKGGRMFRLTEE